MLDGEEEGDLLLGGGTSARDEDDFFLQGNHFACFGERTVEKLFSQQVLELGTGWQVCGAKWRRWGGVGLYPW